MTNRLLMIRPANFGFNVETAASNAFQQQMSDSDPASVAQLGLQEFDQTVKTLRENGIDVLVLDDSADPVKTDAVFPNNWISTHEGGILVTYPMANPSRRNEVRLDLVDELKSRFNVNRWWKLHEEAPEGKFLEGTGSLVLDHENRIAWACRSPRTDEELVRQFCEQMDFEPQMFGAIDDQGLPIYHTNVMMAVTTKHVILCLECIRDESQREEITRRIAATEKQVVELTWPQIEAFAGNMLQLEDHNRQPCIALSTTAKKSLREDQLQTIESESRIIELDIPTLETCGGGSVRCMLAENYLLPKGR
ncbi:MAG: citrulline utilization hydrolase CtlX [Pirellulaceae bacterium]